jgi:hypothetical protein
MVFYPLVAAIYQRNRSRLPDKVLPTLFPNLKMAFLNHNLQKNLNQKDQVVTNGLLIVNKDIVGIDFIGVKSK